METIMNESYLFPVDVHIVSYTCSMMAASFLKLYSEVNGSCVRVLRDQEKFSPSLL